MYVLVLLYIILCSIYHTHTIYEVFYSPDLVKRPPGFNLRSLCKEVRDRIPVETPSKEEDYAHQANCIRRRTD